MRSKYNDANVYEESFKNTDYTLEQNDDCSSHTYLKDPKHIHLEENH